MESLAFIPQAFWIGLFFITGLCFGSFSNVCIYRMPRKESISFPPSHCPKCDAKISPFDNIPILSYALLQAKCRNCKEKISIIYPLVEFACGLALVAIFLKYQISWATLIYSIVAIVLVIITMIDLEHKIIPDRITLPGIVFGFIAGIYLNGVWPSVLGFLVGGGLFYFLAVASRGGMGGGDIKFIAGAGALMGWKHVLLIIFTASLAGGIVGLLMMAFQGKTRKSQIPFGPYLALATFVSIIWGNEMIALYLSTMVPK